MLEEELQEYDIADPDAPIQMHGLGEDPIHEPDTWKLTSDVLIRIHNQPRRKTYVPTEAECPLPLTYLDVARKTETDLDEQALREVHDFWTESGETELDSEYWTGRTIFQHL